MMPPQAPSGKFYDASINGGFNCRDGVGGTDGGPYGTVKVDTSTDTAEIRVSRLSPNTAYEVFLNVTGPGGCSVHLLLPPGQRRLLPKHGQCARLRNSVHNVLALPRRICRGSGNRTTAALDEKRRFAWNAAPSGCGPYVTCFRSHTAGARWAGRPGALCPSGRLASRPGRARCPGRRRGTAACPDRRPGDM
jgi:hypothetical protein